MSTTIRSNGFETMARELGLERILAGARLLDLVALVLERETHRRADPFVVFYEQDSVGHGSIVAQLGVLRGADAKNSAWRREQGARGVVQHLPHVLG